MIDRVLTIFLFIAFLFMMGDMYVFKNTGKRFTYCDGIHLYSLHDETIVIPPECLDTKTDFINYLEVNNK